MLKRYQVLLPDWLEDNIIFFAEKYDLSFSEVIRAEICTAILATVPRQFPDYKPGVTHDDLINGMKKYAKAEIDRGELHRLLSRIYFETRKAVEYRLEREKKRKKQ